MQLILYGGNSITNRYLFQLIFFSLKSVVPVTLIIFNLISGGDFFLRL